MCTPVIIAPPHPIPALSSLAPAIDTAEPHLTHLNIFLTYTPSNTKQSIKLDEKRISTTRPAHLTFYNYNAFVEQVTLMVNRAELLHPSIKLPIADQDTESLRDLAAAANALQSDKDKDEQQPQSEPSLPTSSVTSMRYTVKTIGPTGWQLIDSAEEWYHVLTERAFATWADGVCNIVVELGNTQQPTVRRKLGGESGSADDEVQMEHA
jgi:hypothetical protein